MGQALNDLQNYRTALNALNMIGDFEAWFGFVKQLAGWVRQSCRSSPTWAR